MRNERDGYSQSSSLNGKESSVPARDNVEALDGVRSVVALSSRENDFGWDMNVVDGKSSSEADLTEKKKGNQMLRALVQERERKKEESGELTRIRSLPIQRRVLSLERKNSSLQQRPGRH